MPSFGCHFNCFHDRTRGPQSDNNPFAHTPGNPGRQKSTNCFQRKGKIIGTHAPGGAEIKASCFTHKTAERHFNVQVKSLPLSPPLSPLGLEPPSSTHNPPPAGISLLHICGCRTAALLSTLELWRLAWVNYSVQPSIKQKLAWKVCQKLRKQH